MTKDLKELSQQDIVLWHLARHKTITSMEAFENYGITRLSAKIFDLRESGYKIGMRWETGVNRFGHECRYGVYYIERGRK